ncbi:hypothetical protein F5888DRAFT_1794746 [Russula emetica]|nr:hypothetical protein F5888DRAFT_1794746 [Russula emetica]
MDDTSERSHEPTVDDLRVKLCYICREEERHDSPPHPPTVWTHPCKCTLVAHESCLLHWIKTQQREFGRSRGDLKCPQCGELYEFEGFNPRVLRIFNTVNRTLSRSGRIVTACCIGTIIISSGAGIYLTCASYGAFAVREFVGPDIFRALLTSNPSNWPLHAWLYLPMIPFSLIVSRTPLVIWTTSPLVPLLFPWSSTSPVSAVAHGSSRSIRFGSLASRPTLWPPPPALVCALFPVVRVLYRRLRNRIIRMIVQDIVPPRTQAGRQQQQQQRRANGGDGRAMDNPADQQQQLQRDGPVQEPEQGLPALAPANQDDPQQGQQQQQQPDPEPQQQQRAEPGQGQGQEPVPPARDEDDLGAVAARAIRVTGASLGRLVGGALLMPSIARMMGSMLLHISYVVPLIRTIIAPLPPPLLPRPLSPSPSGPIGTLVRLIRGARVDTVVQVGYRGDGHGWLSGSGLGAFVLRGLLGTSQEWATSDPVWWRNTLGLGIFLVVKDGLKLLHLWLAKRELEERHIKNKSFAGIDLTGLELVERHRPEA